MIDVPASLRRSLRCALCGGARTGCARTRRIFHFNPWEKPGCERGAGSPFDANRRAELGALGALSIKLAAVRCRVVVDASAPVALRGSDEHVAPLAQRGAALFERSRLCAPPSVLRLQRRSDAKI